MAQPSTPPAAGITVAQIHRCRLGQKPKSHRDRLAAEEPLQIRVRGRNVAVTMRTPGNDEELAAGFLLSEGIIHRSSDVTAIAHCGQGGGPGDDNTINVFLSPSVRVNFKHLTRHVFASSSCGLCGKASIDAVHQHFPPVQSEIVIPMKTIVRLPARLRAAQKMFTRTGGLHGAGIFDAKGRLMVAREDAGRHNAVDKVIGHGLLQNLLPFEANILLVSGRASFEIMQKALAARVPVICAVSAPSSLAVKFARESGQTLIGFLRGDTMNIYSHPERIICH